MKGNRGKSNISKVRVFRIKNRLHVSIWQNCTAKFHTWRWLKWHRGLVLALSKRMSHIHGKISWVAAVFWTSGIWCAKSSSCRTPCVNVHQGKNESSPNQADTATGDLPGLWKWAPNRSNRSISAELSLWGRIWLRRSMKGFPSAWPVSSCHSLVSLC